MDVEASAPSVGEPSRHTLNESPFERRNSSPIAVEERIRRAARERDRLQQEAILRNLESEIENLRESARSVVSAVTSHAEEESSGEQRSSHAASTTLSDDRDAYRTNVKRSLRPKEPQAYSGETLQQHREFIRDCEVAFRLTPENYRNESERVLYAMQYLKGEPRDAWWAHFERIDEDDLNWDNFKAFLLDQIADPLNRTLEAAIKYHACRQRPDQTTRAFATHLSTLEDQLEPYSEGHRVQHLFAKLRPDLQVAITNYHAVPSTREGLVALASTLERNLSKQVTRITRNPDSSLSIRSTSVPYRRDSSERRGVKRLYESGRSAGAPPLKIAKSAPDTTYGGVECFNCRQKGHISPNCPHLKKNASNNPNIQPVGRVTGKGRALTSHRGR